MVGGARLWPAAVIVAAGALFVAHAWLVADAIRQWRVLRTIAAAIVVALGLTIWLAFFSRLRSRTRWIGAGAVVLAAVAAAAAFRVRGVTGDFVPVVEPRWTRPPAAPPIAATVPPAAPAEPPSPSATTAQPLAGPTAAASPRAADGWPQFQGPSRDGTMPGLRLARDWSARPPRPLWRQPIGEGWSGFAVAGRLAVTQEQRGPEERVVAFELATGRLVWAHSDAARYDTVIAGVGPRATPSVHAGRVFAQGATGILNALDLASGRRLWRRDVPAENGAAVPEWGRSASPLVLGERVIVSAGGGAGRSLVAYDARTGAPVWAGGSDAASYSSPVLLMLAGRAQVVIVNRGGVAGHDPRSGALLWEAPLPAGQPNVATPLLLAPDRLMVSVGYGVGSKAYRLADDGNGGLTATLLWESTRLKSKFGNLVAHDGYVYGLDDGVFTCLDPANGERRWKVGRYGHGQLLLVGGLLLVQSEDGELVLLQPDPNAHRELARFQALEGKIGRAHV